MEDRRKIELEQLAEDINMLQAALQNGEVPEEAKPQYQKMLAAMTEEFKSMMQDVGSEQAQQSQALKFAGSEQAQSLKFAQAQEQQALAREQQRQGQELGKLQRNMLPEPPSNYLPSPR